LTTLKELDTQLKGQARENPDFFGADYATGLEDLLETHGKGCFGREDRLIGQNIQEFVGKVFNEISQDSSQHALLMSNFQDQISCLTDRAQRCSSRLSEDRLVPERLQIEKDRTQTLMSLFAKHEDRKRAVDKPSQVPELLKNRIAAFKRKNSENIAGLKALELQHKTRHDECWSLIRRQQEYKNTTVRSLEDAQRRAVLRKDLKQSELALVEKQVRDGIQRMTKLIQEIDSSADEALSKSVEAKVLSVALDEAVRMQDSQVLWHAKLEKRYGRGAELLHEFGDWLNRSYEWMGRRLVAKRDTLAKELPAEEERFKSLMCAVADDMNRRVDELRWAREETQSKYDASEREAGRRERVPAKDRFKQEESARMAKLEVEELGKNLEDIERELVELQESERKVREKCGTLESSNRPLQWVQGFLYNQPPPRKRGRSAILDREEEEESLVPQTPEANHGTWKRIIKDWVTPDNWRKRRKTASQPQVQELSRSCQRRPVEPTKPPVPLALRGLPPVAPPLPPASPRPSSTEPQRRWRRALCWN